LISLRRAFGDFEFVWIVEFQERGAPHLHIATTLPSPDYEKRRQFADIWVGISVPFDADYQRVFCQDGLLKRGRFLNTVQAGINVHSQDRYWERVQKRDGISRYFAKYAGKIYQKTVPKDYTDVGRFWGHSRGVKLPDGEYFQASEKDVREFVFDQGRSVGAWEVLPKVILLG